MKNLFVCILALFYGEVIYSAEDYFLALEGSWNHYEKLSLQSWKNLSNKAKTIIFLDHKSDLFVEINYEDEKIRFKRKDQKQFSIKDQQQASAILKELQNKMLVDNFSLRSPGQYQLIESDIPRRAQLILPLVKKWSDHYKLDLSLVMAIIKQESAFNPLAKSWVPALGLMQIVPRFAGKEVMEFLTKKI